jgi:hypothetical protein
LVPQKFFHLSIVVISHNDFTGLLKTVRSISILRSIQIEVVIVSSELSSTIEAYLRSNANFTLKYFFVPPKGIYHAQNFGILNSSGEFVQILNGGDYNTSEWSTAVSQLFSTSRIARFNVYGQYDLLDGCVQAYFGKSGSILPHQSVILAKNVYTEFGLPPTNFRIISDQVFLYALQKRLVPKFYSNIISVNDLTGVSSKISLINLLEKYFLHRTFGQSVICALFKAVVSPFARSTLMRWFGPKIVLKVRSTLNKDYQNV